MYYTSLVDLYLILIELKIIWVRVRVRRDENAKARNLLNRADSNHGVII